MGKKFFIVPLISDAAKGDRPDVVPRSGDVLVDHIKKYIAPGLVIYSDMWKGYDSLGKIGYTHHQVNHSKEFVSTSDPTIHTQNIERLWRDVKEWIQRPGMVLYHLKKYLARYIFCKTVTDAPFHQFLLAAIELYPPNANKQRTPPPPSSFEEEEENDD